MGPGVEGNGDGPVGELLGCEDVRPGRDDDGTAGRAGAPADLPGSHGAVLRAAVVAPFTGIKDVGGPALRGLCVAFRGTDPVPGVGEAQVGLCGGAMVDELDIQPLLLEHPLIFSDDPFQAVKR